MNLIDRQTLQNQHLELSVQKMNKDREFTLFLDEHDKAMQENLDHPSWSIYRKMLTEYEQLNTQLNRTKYYLSKAV